jgi:hypothetical protein
MSGIHVERKVDLEIGQPSQQTAIENIAAPSFEKPPNEELYRSTFSTNSVKEASVQGQLIKKITDQNR